MPITHTGKIRPITGYDEKYLLDECEDVSVYAINKLLFRLITLSDMKMKKSKEDVIKGMSVGDRTSILLECRRMTRGENFSCVVTCPTCKDSLSVDLNISDILKPKKFKNLSGNEQDLKIGNYFLKIRPINSFDQESLLLLPHGTNHSVFQEHLIRTCILSSTPPLPKTLDTEIIEAVDRKLEDLDPNGNIELDVTCSGCKSQYMLPLDLEHLVIEEMKNFAKQLEYDIHVLASNYHWSEKEILSFPIKQRKRYVHLILDTYGDNK